MGFGKEAGKIRDRIQAERWIRSTYERVSPYDDPEFDRYSAAIGSLELFAFDGIRCQHGALLSQDCNECETTALRSRL